MMEFDNEQRLDATECQDCGISSLGQILYQICIPLLCSVRVENVNLPLCEQGLQERRIYSRTVKEVRETNINVVEDKSRNHP